MESIRMAVSAVLTISPKKYSWVTITVDYEAIY